MGSCSSCCCPGNNPYEQVTDVAPEETSGSCQEPNSQTETFPPTTSQTQTDESTLTEGQTQTDESTLTKGQTQTDESTLTEGQTQTDESTLTEGQTQTDESTLTEGQTQTDESILTEGQTQTDESTLTEGQTQTDESTLTEGQTQTDESTLTEGQTQTDESTLTEGQTQTEVTDFLHVGSTRTSTSAGRSTTSEDHEEQTVPKVPDVERSSSLSPSPSSPSSPPPSPEAREDNSNAGTNMFIYGNVQIADSITNNDNTELIAKLVWDADRERERANRLEQGRQRQLSEEERRQHSEQLAAMAQQRDDLRRFVITLDERMSDLTTRLEESQVNGVATRLYENFNVRLLGVESGLACILDIPAAQWETVVQRQSEIQDILASLVIQWNLTPSPDDVDIRLAREVQVSSEDRAQAEPAIEQTLPKRRNHEEQTVPEVPNVEHSSSPSPPSSRSVQASSEEGAQAQPDIEQTLLKRRTAATFDPVSSTLVSGPSVETSVEGDSGRPEITAMISYLGAVFMADNYNSKIKVFSLTAPHQLLHCLPVDGRLWGLAMVTGRQLLAVTLQYVNRIQLIDVTATPVVGQSIRTHRCYEGVGSCDERTLVVSCPRDGQLPASVDIITLEGEVVRTVTSSDEVEDLVNPRFLCVSGDTIYISDYGSHCVHQTDMETGQLTTLPRHPKLKTPCQVTVDPGDNLYVASYHGRCVLVRTVAGEWRELLQGERIGEGDLVYARCVCMTDTGLLLFAPKHTNVHPARLHQKKSP